MKATGEYSLLLFQYVDPAMNSWPKPREDDFGFDDPSVLPPTALGDVVNVRIQVTHLRVRMLEEVRHTLDIPLIIEAVDKP